MNGAFVIARIGSALPCSGKCELHADYRHVGVQQDEQHDETAKEGPEGDAHKYLRVVDKFLLNVPKHFRSAFQHLAAMPFLTVTFFWGSIAGANAR